MMAEPKIDSMYAPVDSKNHRAFRFSLRTLLVVVLLVCAALAIREQQRRLQVAHSVLEAHGLTFSLEPLEKDAFRVYSNNVADSRDTQVRQIAIETLGSPAIGFLLNGRRQLNGRKIPQTSGALQSTTGAMTRSTVTIVASQFSRAGGNNEASHFVRINIDCEGGGYGFIGYWPSQLNLSNALKINLKPGEYLRGTPIELLEFQTGSGETQTYQLIVD